MRCGYAKIVMRNDILLFTKYHVNVIMKKCSDGKVLNPLSGRCVKVGGSIDKKYNLSASSMQPKITVKQLRERCKLLGVKGYSCMDKKELLKACQDGVLTSLSPDRKYEALSKLVRHGKYSPEKERTALMILSDPRVDPSQDDEADRGRPHYIIYMASIRGYTKLVEHLLRDPRVNASYWSNRAIIEAGKNKHGKIVDLLLHDPGVRKEMPKTLRKMEYGKIRGLNERQTRALYLHLRHRMIVLSK